jgi:IS5 family transposase
LENKICGDPMNHLDYIEQPQWDRIIEHSMSKVRSKVEHMFRIAKGLFRFRKVRYRGIKKNRAKLYMLFASANLVKYMWAGCSCWKNG